MAMSDMIPCTLRQLEIFVAAAEDCHFARTAHRLGISQPAVSSHIAALEDRFGKRLFIRRAGSRPMLSEHGIALLREARSFVAESGRLRSFRRPAAESRHTVVRLAAGPHLLDDCIRPQLSAFHERHTDLTLECEYAATPLKGIQLIKSGKADLLLFTVEDPSDYGLHAEVLRSVRFALYASRDFEHHRRASPAEISTLPFVLPLAGSDADRLVQAALLRSGIFCTNVVARAQFSDVILDLARQGRGVAALFETMLNAEDRDRLIRLDVELPMMHRTLFRVGATAGRAVQTVEVFVRNLLR